MRELRYEITDASRDVVNKLLDISSAGSFAEELVQNISSAFRQGEDYMKEFGDAWEQMVDSLIMKSIASNVVGKEVDKLVKKLENRLAEKGAGSEEESEYMKAIQLANDIPRQSGGQFAEWVSRLRRLVGTGNEDVEAVVARLQAVQDYANEIGKSEFSNIVSEFFSPFEEGGAFLDKDFHEKVNEAYEMYEEIAKARYDAKMAIEDEDIQFVQKESKAIQENVINPLMEELKKWYEQGTKDAESLSSLQQGISGITEDTAGAIEAYLNGISQQVYLHSDLLTQIRNAILSFNSDVILDVQGQMLSQLQQSYQIQSSIHNILNGVLSSNGRSFNVEIQ
jgi:flagellin-specific chaperone FliS